MQNAYCWRKEGPVEDFISKHSAKGFGTMSILPSALKLNAEMKLAMLNS